MSDDRDFALGDVLSITSGQLVSRDHIGGVYRILDHMTGDNLFTHQLPRAMDECRPYLVAQYPQLDGVKLPDRDDGWTKDEVFAWLDEQERIFGATLPVAPLATADHTHTHRPNERTADDAARRPHRHDRGGA